MRSTNRSPLTLLLPLLAAFALLVGACSDDGSEEETAPPDTVEEERADAFVEQLNELCNNGRAASDVAGEDLDAAFADIGEANDAGDTEAYGEALEEAESAAEGIIDSIDDFEAALGQVEVPADLQASLDDFLEVKQEQLVLAEDLRDAIVADDGNALQDTIDELEATNDEFDERSLEAAQALGAVDCEPEGDDAAADDSGSDDSGSDDTETFDPDAAGA